MLAGIDVILQQETSRLVKETREEIEDGSVAMCVKLRFRTCRAVEVNITDGAVVMAALCERSNTRRFGRRES